MPFFASGTPTKMRDARKDFASELDRIVFARAKHCSRLRPSRPLLQRLLNIGTVRHLMPDSGTHRLEPCPAVDIDRISRAMHPLDNRFWPGPREGCACAGGGAC